ncbi:MAG: TraM recognition domain-containing protein [Bdellovibrionales bacterium]
MPVEEKYRVKSSTTFRDTRTLFARFADWLIEPDVTVFVYGMFIVLMFLPSVVKGAPPMQGMWDVFLIVGIVYMRWLRKRPFKLPFKMPVYSGMPDPNNTSPGPMKGKAEGILFLGNERKKNNQEVWVSATDAKTHILFLGTTGSGKTEGLKALATNALAWGSGFTFVDGKADTSVWGALYALARRFGRDDDLLVINYMTANSDAGGTSNTMNPFSSGSASYLVQLLTNLMPESGGDNAMWKERAIALISSLMPALTYLRDHHNLLMDIGSVRDNIELPAVIRLSRDQRLPPRVMKGIRGYLDTLPGYVDDAFDDEGKEKPPSPDSPVYDLSVARQQHGYLSMQFTRSLQSLADEYGYIFKSQLADVDVVDLVLNRRILVVLIPALEKSGDEAANLGKIIVANMKGMMGAALGARVEGDWETAIANKATNAPSPYMVIFDEVGYYTAPGMAVMAAQARSLGFSLVFAAQDIPAMEKRVKEEARSITGNCNIKIFGKLEDPTGTKKFFEDSIGASKVFQAKGMQTKADNFFGSYADTLSANLEKASWAGYDDLQEQREGQTHIMFSAMLAVTDMPYIDTGKAKALRVQRMLGVPATTPVSEARDKLASGIGQNFSDQNWSMPAGAPDTAATPELASAVAAYQAARQQKTGPQDAAFAAVAHVYNGAAAPVSPAVSGPAVAVPADTKPVESAKESKTPKVEAASVRRAPMATAAMPSEQDVARSAAARKAEPPVPFELPKPDDQMAEKLAALGKRMVRGLSGKAEREAAE